MSVSLPRSAFLIQPFLLYFSLGSPSPCLGLFFPLSPWPFSPVAMATGGSKQLSSAMQGQGLSSTHPEHSPPFLSCLMTLFT